MPIIVAIEGNVGAGKSTLLRCLAKMGFVVYEENIDTWRSLLELFYDNPKRWSFTLQAAILADLVTQHEAAMSQKKTVVFFERSPCSSMIFAKLARRSKYMSEVEFSTYMRLYEKLAWTADVTIHVDTPPETCMERIKKRARPGEEKVDMNYLEAIDACHRTNLAPEAVTVDGCHNPCEIASKVMHIAGKPGTASKATYL